MICKRELKTVLGTTEFDLVCQLKKGHTGGHRVPLQGSAEGVIFILTWFKENGER